MCFIQARYPISHLFLAPAVAALRGYVTLRIYIPRLKVALIYFQLGREDHRWWWRSFFSGGSTGLFVYAYSFFYFFNTSDMNGLLQVRGVNCTARYRVLRRNGVVYCAD